MSEPDDEPCPCRHPWTVHAPPFGCYGETPARICPCTRNSPDPGEPDGNAGWDYERTD